MIKRGKSSKGVKITPRNWNCNIGFIRHGCVSCLNCNWLHVGCSGFTSSVWLSSTDSQNLGLPQTCRHIRCGTTNPLWLETCTRILSSVAALSISSPSLNHSEEILSITADKCNSCQDFSDTVSTFTHILSPHVSGTTLWWEKKEVSVFDHGKLVSENLRRQNGSKF